MNQGIFSINKVVTESLPLPETYKYLFLGKTQWMDSLPAHKQMLTSSAPTAVTWKWLTWHSYRLHVWCTGAWIHFSMLTSVNPVKLQPEQLNASDECWSPFANSYPTWVPMTSRNSLKLSQFAQIRELHPLSLWNGDVLSIRKPVSWMSGKCVSLEVVQWKRPCPVSALFWLVECDMF